jgi:hypothetical protein
MASSKHRSTRSQNVKQPGRKRSRKDTDEEQSSESDEGQRSLDSDNLDEDFDKNYSRRRTGSRGKGKSEAPLTKRVRKTSAQSEEESDPHGLNLKDGQKVVGVVVQAPKKGQGVFPHPSRRYFNLCV